MRKQPRRRELHVLFSEHPLDRRVDAARALADNSRSHNDETPFIGVSEVSPED
jgi:hypothetical protein